MKTGRIIIRISIATSLIMSVVALCRSLPCAADFDYMGVIVGILSMLVTTLIGWQVINYFMMEKLMRSYAEKLVEKYSHFVNCYAIALTAVTAYERNLTEMGIDTSVQAIEEGLAGYDDKALMLPLSQLAEQAKDCKRHNYKARIYKGKKTEYVKVVSQIDDLDIDKVIEMIMVAYEV